MVYLLLSSPCRYTFRLIRLIPGVSPSGWSSEEAAATCSSCALGKYGAYTGMSSCEDCPAGKYQDFGLQQICKECPVDTYSSATGKSSKADCQACPSDKTTSLVKGSTNVSACLCKKSNYYADHEQTCVACPEGADCSIHDGVMLPRIVAQNGFWRPDPLSTKFSDCRQG